MSVKIHAGQTLLLVRPPPCVGESCSSWAHRVALANGYSSTLQMLRATAGPVSAFLDLDFDPPGEAHLVLGRLTGCTQEVIAALCAPATLTDSWHGVHRRHAVTHRTYRGRRNSVATTPVCVQCVRQRVLARWDLPWRFSWTTNCKVHRTALQDLCSHCQEPIEVDLSRTASIRNCQLCGSKFSVRRIPARDDPMATLDVERHLSTGCVADPADTKAVLSEIFEWGRWEYLALAKAESGSLEAVKAFEFLSSHPPSRYSVGSMPVNVRRVFWDHVGKVLARQTVEPSSLSQVHHLKPSKEIQ